MRPGPVIIVGAGVVGLSCAWWLARKGVAVTVLDRGEPFEGASAGNAGLLSIGHYPLTRPGASLRGVRWMFNRRSPLYIRPRLDPRLLSWLWHFHRHCNKTWLGRALPALCEMGFPSLTAFETIISEESIECDYARDGWLDVVLDPANMASATREAETLLPHGYSHRVLEGGELRSRDPVFRDEVAGAVHYTDSAHCHPGDFMRGLVAGLRRRGVLIRTNAEAESLLGGTRVRLAGGEIVEGSHVVLAAGIWSESLARSAGVRVPMQPARGYHLQLDGMPRLPSTGCVLHETFVAVTPMRRQLRLAGTLEIQPLGRPWMRERLGMLREGAERYLRGLGETSVEGEWAGYRPCTSDGMPLVGAVTGIPGLLIATGHAMMGMTLGPISGRIISELICGDTPCIDTTLLRADRFGVRR